MSDSWIGKDVEVRVDRPIGSRHPEHGFLYPVNYGYLPGTKAPDGEERDAYILGVSAPLEKFNGQCIAIIHRHDDDDDKLVVVPPEIHLSDREIIRQTHFQEQFFSIEIIRHHRVLVDCGANIGAMLERFIQQKKAAHFFAFEPNRDLIPSIQKRIQAYPAYQVTLFNQAVWIYDGEVNFYLGHHETSTLLEGKQVSIRYHHPRRVPCIDFSQWIRRNFHPLDYLTVKMDIEGAEYAVLEKMLTDHTLSMIDELYVEWHHHKFKMISSQRHDALVARVTALTELHEWKH